MNVSLAVFAPAAGAIVTALLPAAWRRAGQALAAIVCVVLAALVLHRLDGLSAVFAGVVSVVSFAAVVYSGSLFPETQQNDWPWQKQTVYFILLGAFWSSMLYAICATTFIGLWTGISATTLVTTFLVGFGGGKAALEAAWKYLVLCSFGVAIALVGILLLARAEMRAGTPAAAALAWSAPALHGGTLESGLVRTALLLMLIGFATKAGLAPMHAWLPDAHSKAPAPISALLSGLLVTSALYAIVRVQGATPAAERLFFDQALLALGAASVLVASTLMLAQRDPKRLLSYSTVEHAGLAALALGIGTPLGFYAAVYHAVSHAFTKSLAFYAAGMLQRRQGRWLFLAALAGLAGFPPFAIFVSELLIVIAAAAAHAWAVLACAIAGITVGFAALAKFAMNALGDRAAVARMPRLAFASASLVGIVALFLAALPFLSPEIRW